MNSTRRDCARRRTAGVQLMSVTIVRDDSQSGVELFGTIWPIALTSALAVILVMSFLYRSIVDLVRELEEREAAAQHQALHDQLTSLANRALLEDRLDQALTRYRRTGEQVALLMLDLDRFKQVNDTLGHNAGDKLVQEVGERLKSLVRETDTVARIGGDEFAIVQISPKGEADVRRLCERIINVIRQPFLIGEREARVGVSIGAVFATKEVSEASELLRKADITMYRAKAAGRDCFRIFTEAMDADVQRRDRIESSLRAELKSGGGLHLHFQPVIGSRGEVVGLEGLMRWNHPSLGHVAPGEMIPIAEECGVIDEVGLIAFRDACRMARRRPELAVAVNLSPAQFKTQNVYELDTLRAAITVIPLPAPLWAGLILIAIGSGFYIGAGLGPGPRDGLMTGVHHRFGWSIRRARTAIELTVLAVGCNTQKPGNDDRSAGDERLERRVPTLLDVLGIMLLGQLRRNPQQLHRHEVESFLLETGNDGSGEATVKTVRFEENQGSLHDGQTLREEKL